MNKREGIRLSIITPVFDTPVAYLESLSDSLRPALGTVDYEWLLIDDHSDDRQTLDALVSLANCVNVRLLRNEGRKGPAGARNFAARQAQAEWLFFVDADDLLVPGSLASMFEGINDHPGVHWLAGDFEDFQLQAPSTGTMERYRVSAPPTIEHWPDAVDRLVFETLVNQGAYIIERALFLKAGGFDERFRVGEDWYLWMRLAAQRELYHCDCMVMLRRRGHESIMSGPLSTTQAIVAPYIAARGDPQFAAQKRLLRWRIFRLYRLLSERNQALGRRGKTLRFALLSALWAINEPRQWVNVLRAAFGGRVR